jgi:hypothetical protein
MGMDLSKIRPKKVNLKTYYSESKQTLSESKKWWLCQLVGEDSWRSGVIASHPTPCEALVEGTSFGGIPPSVLLFLTSHFI